MVITVGTIFSHDATCTFSRTAPSWLIATGALGADAEPHWVVGALAVGLPIRA
jgi:hypothetical protein